MLKKLLKYDLKSIFKFLIVFYILALFSAVCTRFFFQFENSLVLKVISQVFSGVTISMIFNILINNLMRIWVRFRQNFYGDEAYLTHTLPIEKANLYLSKIITAAITLLASFAVITLTLFAAYFSKENFELLKTLLFPIGDIFEMNLSVFIAATVFILFLEFLNILQCGFTGIITGHRMNNAKIGLSVLFGFVTFWLSQLAILLILFIFALVNKDFMNLFFTDSAISSDIFRIIILLSAALYSVISVVICIINVKLFKKGVNVD